MNVGKKIDNFNKRHGKETTCDKCGEKRIQQSVYKKKRYCPCELKEKAKKATDAFRRTLKITASYSSSDKLEEIFHPILHPKTKEYIKANKALQALAQNKMRQSQGGDYAMSKLLRGVHVVIAMQKFMNNVQSERKGNQAEISRLQEAMDHLDFKTVVFQDLKADEITKLVKFISEQDHGQCDAFALTMLSHGDGMHIWASDREMLGDEIWEPFLKTETLRGKPKLIIMNNCRGSKEIMKEIAKDGPGQDTASPPSTLGFLWIHSTRPGYVSYRDETEGSFFVRALCEVIVSEGKKRDFLKVLDLARDKTKESVERNLIQETVKEYIIMSQTPTFKSHLGSKRLIFASKY